LILDPHTELEGEYDRFIEFGGLLDKKMRTYLVQYLKNKFDPDRHLIPELNDKYYTYFTKALDELFLIDGLLDISQQNVEIKKRVILDTIYWLKKSYKEVREKHPFEEEERRLESWSITPLKIFLKRWGALPTYLSSVYAREQLDYMFYRQKFDELITSQTLDQIDKKTQENIDLLFKDLLAQWDALLYAKILDFQMQKFVENKEAYLEYVSNKVSEYRKLNELIEPFTDYFGWDMSRKLWQKTSFNVLEEYKSLLEDESSVKELADLLGSMREAEIELEEETFEKTIVKQEWVKDEMMKSEIVGVHNSNDLTQMISSEALLLGDSITESLFLKKYIDQKLLTFKYEDRKLIRSEDHVMEVHQRVKQKEKGPFIVCIDTSESMMGLPEKIAKVITFGILKMSINQNRRAFLINFSGGVKTYDLYNITESIDEVASFLQMTFNGGTNANLALYSAMRQLETENYEDADVLMVSDFVVYKLNDDIQDMIKHNQMNRNTQFHALAIGSQYNDDVLHYFDTNWHYKPEDKGIIRALTKGLRDIGTRI
jgi:uncharacterized protein with von Willebrand factor type A (vWA) domain